MKRLLTLILGIAVLATLGVLAIAESPVVKSPKSNSSDRAAANSTRNHQSEITGTVSHVDQKTRTFTLKTNGRENKFLFSGSGMLPKVGAAVTVTYTGRLAGSSPTSPPAATATYTTSRSNSY